MRTQLLGSGLIAQSQSSLPPFVLHRPASLPEAMETALRKPNALIVAGCSDLVAQFREGLVPDEVVSLQRVPELTEISHENGVLSIGSMVTHHRGSASPVVREVSLALAEAWKSIATVRIRFKATIGGNLMSRRHRYEMPIILSAVDAEMHFCGELGDRRLPVSALWDAEKTPSGLLTKVTVETDSLDWFGYDRSMRPLTTVALSIRSEGPAGLRITATCGSEYRKTFIMSHVQEVAGVWELDARSVASTLVGQLPEEAADYSGTIDYRRHLVGVLCRRLLQSAIATANERTTL